MAVKGGQIRLEWIGLDDLRKALLALPEQLAREAGDVIVSHANAAMTEIKDAYPERSASEGGTGMSLKQGLRLRVIESAYGATVQLVNLAKHAHLYEFGTAPRRLSWGPNRGSMPPHPTFVPIAQRTRSRMRHALIAIVERAGFTVRDREAA